MALGTRGGGVLVSEEAVDLAGAHDGVGGQVTRPQFGPGDLKRLSPTVIARAQFCFAPDLLVHILSGPAIPDQVPGGVQHGDPAHLDPRP